MNEQDGTTSKAPTGPPPPIRESKFTRESYQRAVARTAELPRAQKAVLQSLLGHADRTGFARPSQQTIADETGFTPRYVRRLVHALEAGGWLRVDRPEATDKAGRPKHYTKGSAEPTALRYWLLQPGDQRGVDELEPAPYEVSDERRCLHVDEDGKACRAWAMKGHSRCRHHRSDEAIDEELGFLIDKELSSSEEVSNWGSSTPKANARAREARDDGSNYGEGSSAGSALPEAHSTQEGSAPAEPPPTAPTNFPRQVNGGPKGCDKSHQEDEVNLEATRYAYEVCCAIKMLERKFGPNPNAVEWAFGLQDEFAEAYRLDPEKAKLSALEVISRIRERGSNLDRLAVVGSFRRALREAFPRPVKDLALVGLPF